MRLCDHTQSILAKQREILNTPPKVRENLFLVLRCNAADAYFRKKKTTPMSLKILFKQLRLLARLNLRFFYCAHQKSGEDL